MGTPRKSPRMPPRDGLSERFHRPDLTMPNEFLDTDHARLRHFDQEAMVDTGNTRNGNRKGLNPLGFTGQTKNGTAHWRGNGWNRCAPNDPCEQSTAVGFRQKSNPLDGSFAGNYPGGVSPQVSDKGPWNSKRSNRTGE